MSEDMSTSMRIAVTVYLTASMLAIVVGILGSSIRTLNGFTDKYNVAVNGAAGETINNIGGRETLSGALVYSKIMEALNTIDRVDVKGETGVWDTIYTLGDNETDLLTFMAENKNKKYSLRTVRGEYINTMTTVKLEEVKK